MAAPPRTLSDVRATFVGSGNAEWDKCELEHVWSLIPRARLLLKREVLIATVQVHLVHLSVCEKRAITFAVAFDYSISPTPWFRLLLLRLRSLQNPPFRTPDLTCILIISLSTCHLVALDRLIHSPIN